MSETRRTPAGMRIAVFRQCIAEIGVLRAEGPTPSAIPGFRSEQSFEAGYDEALANADVRLRQLMRDR